LWCGTGWTGQPVIWEKDDGITEIIFGAYDKAVHFLDGATGVERRPPFPVGDIIKGSVTLDPDGYPLLYFGSRDDKLRIVALDREEPTELWSLEASSVQGIWNNDWDGNPVVIDDVLYEGGENGWFFAIRLNRSYDAGGNVTVEPSILFQERGWNAELLANVGPNVSIESSVAVFGHTAYFANSGGRVAGFDIARVLEGVVPLAFDYWVGDDTDATVVVDEEGSLYVAVEEERRNARSKELGQLIKLNPLSPDPFVWGLGVPGVGGDGGIWATPAVAAGMLYVTTNPGELLAVDGETGGRRWDGTPGRLRL
jgi:outer membrane protein assembly factor BamB